MKAGLGLVDHGKANSAASYGQPRQKLAGPYQVKQSERISASPLESRLRCVEFFMVRNWTPSIVPGGHDQTVYLVADDFGRIGRVWIEADYEGTDLETVIEDLMSGQYNNPIRVIAFNTTERRSEDVSEDVA
jgi:hypothetical protein